MTSVCTEQGGAASVSKEPLLCMGPAYQRPSEAGDMVCPCLAQGLIKGQNKAASTRPQPSAGPASTRGCREHLAGPPACLPASLGCGLPAPLPPALPLPPQPSPPSSGAACAQARPAAPVVITHANARAWETKRGQARGSGIPVDKQY